MSSKEIADSSIISNGAFVPDPGLLAEEMAFILRRARLKV